MVACLSGLLVAGILALLKWITPWVRERYQQRNEKTRAESALVERLAREDFELLKTAPAFDLFAVLQKPTSSRSSVLESSAFVIGALGGGLVAIITASATIFDLFPNRATAVLLLFALAFIFGLPFLIYWKLVVLNSVPLADRISNRVIELFEEEAKKQARQRAFQLKEFVENSENSNQ